MKKTLTVLALLAAGLAANAAEPTVPEKPNYLSNLSIETLGVIRHNNIHDGVSYGAGVNVGYSFNRYVTGVIGLVTYEDDGWRGTAIDQGSLLVMATLLQSKNGGVLFSAVGGGYRRFDTQDWGFGVGPRLDIHLSKKFGIFGQSVIQAFIHGDKAVESSAGLFLTL